MEMRRFGFILGSFFVSTAASTGGLFTKHGFGGVTSFAGEPDVPAPHPPPPAGLAGDSLVLSPQPLLFEGLVSSFLPQPSWSSSGLTTEPQPLFDAAKIDQ